MMQKQKEVEEAEEAEVAAAFAAAAEEAEQHLAESAEVADAAAAAQGESPPSPGEPASSKPEEALPPEETLEGPASSSDPHPKKKAKLAVAHGADRGRSPEEILSLISPPGCKFGMGHKDHRWTSVWKEEEPHLEAPYSQLSLSRSFAQKKGWVECLQEVHRHNWNKWRLIKHSYPLEPGQEEQEPGYIPQAVLDALKPKVDSLGKVVRYTKKWGWWGYSKAAG